MESPTNKNATPRPTSILVVDDDPALREFLVMSLRLFGYVVHEAASGRDGLQLAREQRPDLVLLDVVMPGMNGLEVCREIKTDPSLQSVFVLLMSGRATDVQSEVRGRESGADDYLIKPFNESLLLARVRTSERVQQAEEKLRQLNQSLEQRVAERTSALETANRTLAGEIAERKRAEEALQSLPRRILDAQEAERKRVARELHDGVSQLLAAVRFRLRGLEAKLADGGLVEFSHELGRTQEHLERAVEEVRRVSRNLRPGELDDLGFLPAINSACAEFTARTGITVDLESSRLPARLAPEMELAVYRIVQEALTNIERHAQAAKVTLRLTQIGSQLLLSVNDDGRGFAPDELQTNRIGLGLVNMRERAAHLGGKTRIVSQPGGGTEITVRLPLHRAGPEKSASSGKAGAFPATP